MPRTNFVSKVREAEKRRLRRAGWKSPRQAAAMHAMARECLRRLESATDKLAGLKLKAALCDDLVAALAMKMKKGKVPRHWDPEVRRAFTSLWVAGQL